MEARRSGIAFTPACTHNNRTMKRSDDTASAPPGGRLADNIAYFARALRNAGVPVGPAQVVDAVRAVALVGVGPRSDFYWTLHGIFVRRHEHSDLFDQAFDLFWRKRNLIEKMMAMMMPSNAPTGPREKEKPANRRISDAMFDGISRDQPIERPVIDIDARFSASSDDIVRRKDFDQMTASEIARAKRLIAKLRLVFPPRRTRRFKSVHHRARIDPRRTLKASVRGGGGAIALKHRASATKVPPVVAICDISGSMSQYSRLFLHFLHALTDDQHRVHSFVFGTRLTNVTRQLRHRDVDEALAGCAAAVVDWSGGTRISQSLRTFNRLWSRRVLSQGATVLLITDGLERDDDGRLGHEIDRLHRSCRRLIWLNPLLRYDGFEAKAHGIRTMLPHVDAFCPIHNLDSMEELVAALAEGPRSAPFDARAWLKAA